MIMKSKAVSTTNVIKKLIYLHMYILAITTSTSVF